MIDPATSWFEMRQIENRSATIIANIVEQTWLCRYPWPRRIIFDRGTEFMAEFIEMIKEDYGIAKKATTSRNTQDNSILERSHQIIGNMIKTFQIYNIDDLDNDPWSGILSSVMFGLKAKYHSTLKATPA